MHVKFLVVQRDTQTHLHLESISNNMLMAKCHSKTQIQRYVSSYDF